MRKEQMGSPPDVSSEDKSPESLAELWAPEIRRLLLGAYDEGKRELPWRGEADPYRVWVSEVMLQQTRVETVIPFYKEWMNRFPDLEALAAADEEEVLRAWQGLGYYSRARNLHSAARVVREQWGGDLPGSSKALRALPGVGAYTAGAVASIAFGEVVPAVDGNVRRVFSRLFDLPSPSPGALREFGEVLVDPLRPGDFNQALMELGALVCTPRSPICEMCPLGSRCLARERGTEGDRPTPKRRAPVPEVDLAVAVASNLGGGSPRFLLRRRPAHGLLGGMWEFPAVELAEGAELQGVVTGILDGLGVGSSNTWEPGSPVGWGMEVEEVREGSGKRMGEGSGGGAAPASRPLEPVTHVFSHLRICYHPFLVLTDPGAGERSPGAEYRWMDSQEIRREVPLPVAQTRILELALRVLGPGSEGFPTKMGQPTPCE